MTRGPQWVLKLDRSAGTKAWMECLCERCHVNTAAGEGAEGRASEPSALLAPMAGKNSRTCRIRPAGCSLPTAGLGCAAGPLFSDFSVSQGFPGVFFQGHGSTDWSVPGQGSLINAADPEVSLGVANLLSLLFWAWRCDITEAHSYPQGLMPREWSLEGWNGSD